jgi:hypothetical protein
MVRRALSHGAAGTRGYAPRIRATSIVALAAGQSAPRRSLVRTHHALPIMMGTHHGFGDCPAWRHRPKRGGRRAPVGTRHRSPRAPVTGTPLQRRCSAVAAPLQRRCSPAVHVACPGPASLAASAAGPPARRSGGRGPPGHPYPRRRGAIRVRQSSLHRPSESKPPPQGAACGRAWPG